MVGPRWLLAVLPLLALVDGGCRKPTQPTGAPESPESPAPLAPSTLGLGESGACLLDDAGVARCWGSNESHQLGLDDRYGCFDSPTPVPGTRGLSHISSGEFASCGLGSDGRVTCWGSMSDYRPGATTSPHDIPEVAPAVKLANGASHACALHDDGTVTCWGNNQRSSLGRATSSDAIGLGPAPVEELPPARDIAAGGGRSCAVGRDGRIRCWGQSQCNWTGPDLAAPERPRLVPGLEGMARVAVSARMLCGVSAGGTVACHECETGDLAALRGLSDVTDVQVEDTLGCALHGNGTVSCWEGSSEVVPSLVPGLVGAVEIAVARQFACARDGTGAISCWGDNWNGALGAGPASLAAARAEPVPGVGDVASIAVTDTATFVRLGDGRVLWWGDSPGGGDADDPTTPTGPILTEAIELAASKAHVCAIRSDGTVHCWGSREVGRNVTVWGSTVPVRVGTLTGVSSVAVADNEVCAVVGKRAVCWRTEAHAASPEQVAVTAVAGLTDVVRVAAGSDHFCALLANGQVRCWGADGSGLQPAVVKGRASAIVARGSRTCALVDGVPWCWFVGAAPHAPANMTGVLAVAVGTSRTCVIRSDRTLSCTGAPFELGSCQPSDGEDDRSAELGALDQVSAVAISDNHACALTDDGVHCWGWNYAGQLGLADVPLGQVQRPVQIWPR